MRDTMVGMILYLFCLPVLFVMTAFFVNETKPKKNIILGVTLPFFARDDERVAQICFEFKKKIWIASILLAALGIPISFLPYFSVQLTAFFLWLLAVIFVPNLLFARAHLRLKALKRRKKWFFQQYAGQTIVDLSTVGRTRGPLSGWWFFPPLLLSLLPALLAAVTYRGEELTGWLVSCGALFAMVLLSFCCYPLIFRQKADVVDENSAVNAALTNVRRINWGRAWIDISWATALLGLGFWFFRDQPVGILVLSGVYTLLLMALCFYTEFSTRHAQEILTAQCGKVQYVDEDAYWIWGMFYCNPNDRHLAVNDRVGMNMSLNLARPAGKVIMGVCALLIAAMPLIGIWAMAQEFSPRTVRMTEEACAVTHLTEQFSVPYSEIRSVNLTKELPQYSRLVGTGLDSLCEGRFRVGEYGVCVVSFDPRQKLYLILQTDAEAYIFNLESPEQTKNCYVEIQERRNQYE